MVQSRNFYGTLNHQAAARTVRTLVNPVLLWIFREVLTTANPAGGSCKTLVLLVFSSDEVCQNTVIKTKSKSNLNKAN